MKYCLVRGTLGLTLGLLVTGSIVAQCNPIGIESFETATPTTTSECSTISPGTLPVGWAQGAGTTSAWRVFSGPTPSGSTGPQGDHTTGAGNYVYVEVSGCNTAFGYLEPPCFDATGVQNPTLSFWYHMYGATMGSLSVQEQDAQGVWQTIWTRVGDQADAWHLSLVPITPVNDVARFRFFYVRGANFTGDCCLDDIAFGEPTTGGNCVLPGDQDFEGATVAPQLICGQGDPGGLPTGWVNLASNVTHWRVNSGSTPSGGTGPSGDHTTGSGNYIYVETSGCTPGATGVVETPCWTSAGITAPTLEFWYHMYGQDMGTLEVQQHDGAGNWNPVWTIGGDQGNQWHQAAVLITPIGGLVRIRFHYERGANFRSDCAIDDVRFGEPSPGDWEINLPGARLDVDGAIGSTLFPVQLQRCTTEEADLNLASTNVGLPFDIAVTGLPIVPASGGGLTTPNGQHINLNLLSAVWIYGGGTLSLTTPFPGNFTLPILTAPFLATASTQMFVVDPGHADGVSLSQATQIDTVAASPLPGPTTDEEIVTIPLPGLPLCGPSTLPFYGTAYASLNVHSNGRVSFGPFGTVDFSASPAEARLGVPFVGFWTDLDASFGTITVQSPDQNIVEVAYQSVRYFDETTSVSFVVSFDAAQGTVTLDGLSGIPVNPVTGVLTTAGDRQFLGISGGGVMAATDGGPVLFSPGGSGSAAAADMIYDFHDHLGANPALVPSLGTTSLNRIVFTPAPPNYTWMGF